MIVKIISEGLNVRNNILSSLLGEMARKEHYFEISAGGKKVSEISSCSPKVTYPISPEPEFRSPGTF